LRRSAACQQGDNTSGGDCANIAHEFPSPEKCPEREKALGRVNRD